MTTSYPRVIRQLPRWWATPMLVVMLLGWPCLPACGPDVEERADWMLGTFSHTNADVVVQGTITRYTIHEDNTFEIIGLYGCRNDEILTGEYAWKNDGSDAIDVFDPGGGDVGGFDAWRLQRTGDCNRLLMEFIDGGRVVADEPIYRGVMCMQELDPCDPGVECDGCQTVWCDGSPPACDEE